MKRACIVKHNHRCKFLYASLPACRQVPSDLNLSYLRMKTKLPTRIAIMATAVLCLFSFFNTTKVYGQDYVPLIDIERKWNVASIIHGGASTDELFFGDTILLEDTLYYEVLVRFPEKSELLGYLREDINAKKVYYRNNSGQEPTLLYDFSLEEGDTVRLYGNLSLEYTILQVDSIELLTGDFRKRWVLSPEFGENPIWIEGIGNTTLYLLNSGDLNGSTLVTRLLCCYENNELVYMNVFFNTCYLSTSHVEGFSNTSLRIWPNPTKGIVTLSFPQFHKYNDVLFEVLSIDGRKLLSKPIHSELSTLDISNLPAGMYLYRFTDGRHQLKIEKLIIN
jgi:hypothetical protein